MIVLSLETIFEKLKTVPTEDKLKEFLSLSGCHIDDDNLITSPSVSLCGLGGMGFQQVDGDIRFLGKKVYLEDIQDSIKSFMACSAGMSYLNQSDMDLDKLYDKVVELEHFSVAHTVSVNILVSGISCGVENEFNSQRDLIHLSRITVARTGIQSSPPLILPDESLRDAYKRVLKASQDMKVILDDHYKGKDFNEASNLLFPAAKASAFIMSGSIRNIQKLVSGYNDQGKEREYRNVLSKVSNLMNRITPDLFNELSEIPYNVKEITHSYRP